MSERSSKGDPTVSVHWVWTNKCWKQKHAKPLPSHINDMMVFSEISKRKKVYQKETLEEWLAKGNKIEHIKEVKE